MSKNIELKPIKEWFLKGLEDPHKSKAIKYAEYFGMENKMVKSLYDALKEGFVWQFTQENSDFPGYWNSLAQKILFNQEKNKN